MSYAEKQLAAAKDLLMRGEEGLALSAVARGIAGVDFEGLPRAKAQESADFFRSFGSPLIAISSLEAMFRYSHGNS